MKNQNAEQLLKRLEWRVLRRLDGLLHGDYRTLFRGAGIDLADLREYQTHDDVRHIDWNVTARMGTPYVREFLEDRDLTAWFLVDVSASMMFGSGERTKHECVVEFATALASCLSARGNRVGALLFDRDVEAWLPARSGRAHVLQLAKKLLVEDKKASNANTDLSLFLNRSAQAIKRRSLVFVISDFMSATPWDKALARLAQKHEVIAVRPVDPLENALPDLGMVYMADPETGEQLWVDTSSAGFRARFAALAEEAEARVVQGFAHAGVDAIELSTDEDVLATLTRFAMLRKRRIRGNSPNHPVGVAA
jgi:uncharacterized protein (DUF58 family)